jgi:hypothetical protein
LSAAPGTVQLATPFSSSSPTVFSHRRRPTSAALSSSVTRFVKPVCAAPLRTELLMVGTAKLFAQSASRFQMPQPPIDWRVQPLSE